MNRLKDILDTHIVIGNVEDGKTFYRTKGGTEIRVNNVSGGAGKMTVEGSYQMNESSPVTVSVSRWPHRRIPARKEAYR